MDWLFRYSDPNLDWNYAMLTLMVRFIGVFVVMLVIQIALQISSRVVGYIEREEEAGGAAAMPGVGASLDLGMVEEQDISAEVAAVIGLALTREGEAVPRIEPGQAANWTAAGRLHQLVRAASLGR